MVRHGEELRTVLRGLLKPIAVLVLFAILLLAEPDFGATVIMMGTALACCSWAALAGVRVWSSIHSPWWSYWDDSMAPYRMKRLMAYQDPWRSIR